MDRRLLVVDDEQDMCEFVECVAQGVGYEVTTLDQAEQFFTYYSDDLSAIILDLTMPGMDGIELIRFLSNQRSEAAVILISGVDSGVLRSAQSLASHHGLHVVGTLSKPFSVASLEAMLINIPEAPSIRAPQYTGNKPPLEELRAAIASRSLVCHYQPKIELASRALVGVEALVRWQRTAKEMISPAMFVPMAEENGLIGDLTMIVQDLALEQCALWNAAGLRIKVSINMSPRTLSELDFPDRLEALVQDKGITPSQVVIEVTESSVIEQLTQSLDILTRLRMKGFGLSIDDFGTGYSSMEQLKQLPFSELKIDQSFVRNADTDADARAIVKSTVELGHALGMTLVAEGIETQAVWDLLAGLGCNQGQGYLMARPMLGADLERWLGDWNKADATLSVTS